MNNFLSTKPISPPTRATSKGWVNAETGELLVAIRDLDKKLGDPAELQPGLASFVDTPIKRGPGRPKGSKAKPKVRAV